MEMHVQVRLAGTSDVPNIHRLVGLLAEHESLSHYFSATVSSLSATLFPPDSSPPFQSTTALILDASSSPFSNQSSNTSFLQTTLKLESPVQDPESDSFFSPTDQGLQNGVTITTIGMLICTPCFAALHGGKGLNVDVVMIRETWRKKGLGRMMFDVVAREAMRLGFVRVQWLVNEGNNGAIKFYEKIGAEMAGFGWKGFLIAGERLRVYAEKYDHGEKKE